jgi:hypothetical protein
VSSGSSVSCWGPSDKAPSCSVARLASANGFREKDSYPDEHDHDEGGHQLLLAPAMALIIIEIRCLPTIVIEVAGDPAPRLGFGHAADPGRE